ncbi:hypothetical protein [Mucilaginibacter sp. SJ]|uniref:hypothetical protein n=1 Tax=Mucilaginibacter sp. SJ TaxID=3029053 RepID=UPI0023AA0B65|nr:hypothetical protein [Mucilaginibacter sp. SJ]WEA03861.1 hypothetical protein MusilaSJ_13045 [Mucilaginibacter sp. SJ]
MLKQKIKLLVAQNKLGQLQGFEVIHDQSAVQIIGGVVSCPNLSTCVTYTGDCPSLVKCGSFTDAS